MNLPPPPIPSFQRKEDADHLQLLAIFHFIGGGLALIGLLFIFGHYMVFHAFFENPQVWTQVQHQNPQQAFPQQFPPQQFFMMFRFMYVIFAVWFVGSGVLNVISGFCISARKHRTFSIVVAAINCLHIPLGTVLGVFTIIVMMRDSVREIYENPQA
ncbi:MAG: hypothetical protein WCD79_03750 [Chthoniobacteraceae bacterium]